ncbi:2-succinyl-5-enolpyruvyl-6-hydroxy-3- cyclohexene -1-carboxylate synthase 1 [Bifidobacterium pullorum subsp. saeculare DSM 6531 = LMG 14934]|uniref:2-succinyl-5-enolpyruvyl-6-hydroxy-3-cyclohexene-1-carboxylate synthase 1 n=1 Tax=Bifidobacterium pullorum subsp. saeculare DSM 6531 = LMG 14934 TaxID=1437611 RepID=A0A087CTF7_9BIFI|nr:2-succinyl-5-enolpyruvyl-6-hydroxy-3-cyclohexene-1-carboxylic-acid synthase [Bifidobacterium pullorum]KFI86557.1 2-succinyl-5-enolpyruvyl-6-hydroxy-3- cyclohexene -1-carboxylate synthase 1 [Bifidobacterium pullorum subsp. saeculare DSM 6531 = LMG 14934]
MYTELKSYQIIIALLKKYGIRRCVLSAGSRNVPFVHSVEEDPFFECYSVVDERSAGYFALGLAQESKEPVVISCTSSTATCNYWPPVAEAYYQGVPLVVLTSDRDPAMLGQWEDQMIDQVGMYDRHVRKSVNLPIVNDHDDWLFCQRLVNEALLELDHHGTGPVHINVPMRSYNNSFNVRELPEVTRIRRVEMRDGDEMWRPYAEKLASARRILVVAGQTTGVSAEFASALERFCSSCNTAVAAEYMANVPREHAFNPTLCMEYRYVTKRKFAEFLPDVVVSFGGNMTAGLKDMLRKFAGTFEHWSIREDGSVCDMFKSLTEVFECTPEEFFSRMARLLDGGLNDGTYLSALKTYEDQAVVPELPWSNALAIKRTVERIPSGSLLHLAVNNAIRLTNFFDLQPDVKVYANIGTHGIDGPVSSFLGQAIVSDKPAYLVVGDLAFFYDMNALRLRHIGDNAHILLLNNQGGEEFYFNGMWKDEASDLHTTARHHTKAEGWVRECGFHYLSAHNEVELDAALETFFDDGAEGPVLLEVFSEMKSDSDVIYSIFDATRPRDAQSEAIRCSKEFIKRTIGQEKAQRIAGIFKKGR